ncbi:TetR/AcrR family transcriptional regulator [Actinoplanes sp. NPDC049265]|uniref:TetR/AcrR family transcriptional regulator n=1 Tax=Actinoplanes sp. NPDC049265 TaxID=3363902 RepID=UPI00371D82C5
MPERSARQPRRDAALNRERVLDAATDLVRREGEKVPMADIAGLAGVGVGTVYRHFPTREDLMGAMVHRSFTMALSHARAAAAHPGPAGEAIRDYLAGIVRDRDRFILPLQGGPLIFTAAIRELQGEIRGVLQVLLDRGKAAGEIRPDLSPEDVIVTSAVLARPLPAIDDWDMRANRYIELLVNGIRADGPG